jgi:hypothetical protein
MVLLPPGVRLLLDSFVVAKMPRISATGLVVPREAVLPGEDGSTLFTVKDGKAVKHKVKVGIENDEQVQIIADDVAEGDLAVIVGNYELEDGMAVKVQETLTPPATTEPASTQPAETQPAGGPKAETQPSETQPARTQPAGTQPSSALQEPRRREDAKADAKKSNGLSTKNTETTKSTEERRRRRASVRVFDFPLCALCGLCGLCDSPRAVVFHPIARPASAEDGGRVRPPYMSGDCRFAFGFRHSDLIRVSGIRISDFPTTSSLRAFAAIPVRAITEGRA